MQSLYLFSYECAVPGERGTRLHRHAPKDERSSQRGFHVETASPLPPISHSEMQMRKNHQPTAKTSNAQKRPMPMPEHHHR